MVVLVWGTGRLAGKVIGKHIDIHDVHSFIDNDVNKTEYMGKAVIRPQELKNINYDAVLVALQAREQIQKQCREEGIDTSKFIFLYDNCTLNDVNNYDFVSKVVGNKYSSIIKNRYHVVRGVEAYGDLCFTNNYTNARGGGTSKPTMCA